MVASGVSGSAETNTVQVINRNPQGKGGDFITYYNAHATEVGCSTGRPIGRSDTLQAWVSICMLQGRQGVSRGVRERILAANSGW